MVNETGIEGSEPLFAKSNTIWMVVSENIDITLRTMKTVAFSAILFPCLFHTGAVFPSEKQHSAIDGSFVLEKCIGECVHGGGAVLKCNNLIGEGITKFVCDPSVTGSSFAQHGKCMTDTMPGPLRQNPDNEQRNKPKHPSVGVTKGGDPFNHDLFWLLLGGLIIVLPSWRVLKPNVEVRGDKNAQHFWRPSRPPCYAFVSRISLISPTLVEKPCFS